MNLIRAFFNGWPFQTGFYFSRKAQQHILQIIEKHQPDHLYAQLIRTTEYIRRVAIPKTFDYQDAFSENMKRRAYRDSWYLKPLLENEASRLKKYERSIFSDFDHATIISETDRDFIDHPEKNKIKIIPNGIDTDFFYPVKADKKYDLVFVGNMNYAPNIDGAEYLVQEIIPLVQETIPDIKVLLAGAKPHRRVQKLAQQNHVDITGWVDDIRDSYAAARLFIAPMRIGSGLQNKLLEAMAMKMACITTPIANISLGAKPGKEIMVGENARELADHIVLLLSQKQQQKQIAENGYLFVRSRFSWGAFTYELEQLMTKKNESAS
jgi:glycosyltransferase involved in cell wall biosynthesis